MELKGNGVVVQVNPAEQSDVWLVRAYKEIVDTARERGLELPLTAGAIAIEGALQVPETALTVEAPTPPTKESFAEQLESASRGYKAVINSLNKGRRKKDILAIATNEKVAEEFEAWFSEDKLAYVTAVQETDPEVRFTLTATPNVLVNYQELAKSAEAFGQDQPNKTIVADNLFYRYTPEQLSGTDPSNGNSVVFSLIPSKYTPEMNGTVFEQRAKLAILQSDTPELKVPSPLEAVTYWHSLRAQGDQLVADNATYYQTYIRHFDISGQLYGRWSYHPESYVDGDGGPFLNYSRADDRSDARVAVG